MKITFSVDQHDQDGDEVEKGIYLWLDDKFCLKTEDTEEIESLVNSLKEVLGEIKESYPNR